MARANNRVGFGGSRNFLFTVAIPADGQEQNVKIFQECLLKCFSVKHFPTSCHLPVVYLGKHVFRFLLSAI